jgi:nitrate reductase gamma subunit
MTILYLFTYVSILVFIVLVIKKIIKYSSMPIHLRWELYPVAHEAGKYKYGGSYFEEPEWWNRKNKKNHLNELLVMFEEIFLLKGVYKHNKKLWLFSFPFHLGLYLIVTTFVLITGSAILDINSVISFTSAQTTGGSIIFYLIDITGYSGLALTFVGAVGLIIKRISDTKYKFYNTPLDFINLIFIIVLIVSVFLTLIFSNPYFNLSKEFVKNLLTFNFINISSTLFIIHVVLISLFLLYFPLTRMMHLFAKYFTYHSVRWDDKPNVKGGKLEKRIKEALDFGVSWSAPHMKSGKTWAEIATTLPPEIKNVK